MRVDFHAHFLPGLDHGCGSLETCIDTLKKLKECGVDCAVATHHFIPGKDNIDTFLKKREAVLKNVLESLPQNEGINIEVGAEVYCSPDISSFEDIKKLCIADTSYMLLELPYDVFTPWLIPAIHSLIMEYDITPIIAHIERYTPVRKDPSIVAELIDMGCLIQVNGYSLKDKSCRKLLKKLFKAGAVHLIGSDFHEGNKVEEYGEAFRIISRKFGRGYIDMIDSISERVINGEYVNPPVYKRLKKV